MAKAVFIGPSWPFDAFRTMGLDAHMGRVQCPFGVRKSARIATLMGMGSSSTPTAFVLSGGASLGAIQVGMLHALYEREIQPDLIAATSAGALNGAFIAARPQNVATAGELAEIWIGLRRGTVFPLNPLTGLFGFAGRRGYMVPDSGLRALIGQHLTTERLEALPIPLARGRDRRAHGGRGEALRGTAAGSDPREHCDPGSACRTSNGRAAH